MSFTDSWKFEADIRSAYPEHCTVKYGERYQSKTGKTMCDWVVKDGRKEIAKHTMLFLVSQKGNAYAVVSVNQKPKPVSAEVKAIMNEIAAKHTEKFKTVAASLDSAEELELSLDAE